MTGGKMSKARQNVILTTVYLKQVLDLPLSPREEKAEMEFQAASQS